MIKVVDIVKSFSDHRVLDGVSFSLLEGEIYGLIGKNGVGKTTLMNIMAGLSKPDLGYCLFKELNSDNNTQIKIGYLPDLPSFYEYLSAGEYLDFLLMGCHADRKKDLLNMVDLSDDVKISTMSRGMRQRLGIAAAMVSNPDIILLDEPTSALDPSGRAEVMGVLSDLKKKGKSIVLSTHILADMERICDRVGFLSEGVIKKEIRIDSLDEGYKYIQVKFVEGEVDRRSFDELNVEYEVLGENCYRFKVSGDSLKSQNAIFSAISKQNIMVSSIHSETKTLDKMFQEVCG